MRSIRKYLRERCGIPSLKMRLHGAFGDILVIFRHVETLAEHSEIISMHSELIGFTR